MEYQQEINQTNLRKLLAAAVRNIQWSYSIFWTISSSDPCVLEWVEGYYNGDVKTRRTVQAMELDINQVSLQRSEQLRELYESLLTSESSSNPQAKRPTAALSPEDLSNTEWYYLVCMSFIFTLGEGLPGKSYIENRPIWLSNAPQADSLLFNRSLLAKSASIQTVVCFPYLGGVIELGTTELVLEDLALIQYAQASLLGTDINSIITSQQQHNLATEQQQNSKFFNECRLLESPKSSSNGLAPIHPPEIRMPLKDLSQEITDDERSNCVYPSIATSDCISQSLSSPVNVVPDPMIETVVDNSQTKKLGGTNIHQQLQSSEDLHYLNVLSALFKTNQQLISASSSVSNMEKGSCCFLQWSEGVGTVDLKQNSKIGSGQQMLKKILVEVPHMHVHSFSDQEDDNEDGFGKDNPVASSDHVLTERRREKVNMKFSVLKSHIPSVNKVDKVSILDNTIAYLKELETRIAEIEAYKDVDDCELERSRSYKPEEEEMEGISETCNCNRRRTGMKRKACDLDYNQQEENLNNCCQIPSSGGCSENSSASVSVGFVEKDIISIYVKCPWKEGLVLRILGVLGHLQLDGHSVECLTADNILSISMNAKVNVSGGLSVGKIRQVIQRAIRNC